MGFNSDVINSEAHGHIRLENYSKCLPGYLSGFVFALLLCLTKERHKPLVELYLCSPYMPSWFRQGRLLHIFREHHERLVLCQFRFSSTVGPHTVCSLRSVLPFRRHTFFLTYLLTYSLTYLLAPWSRVLLEKLTGFHLVKKFPAFYGTQRFVTAVTRARHLLFDCFATCYVFYYEELLAPRPPPQA